MYQVPSTRPLKYAKITLNKYISGRITIFSNIKSFHP